MVRFTSILFQKCRKPLKRLPLDRRMINWSRKNNKLLKRSSGKSKLKRKSQRLRSNNRKLQLLRFSPLSSSQNSQLSSHLPQLNSRLKSQLWPKSRSRRLQLWSNCQALSQLLWLKSKRSKLSFKNKSQSKNNKNRLKSKNPINKPNGNNNDLRNGHIFARMIYLENVFSLSLILWFDEF